MIERNIGTWERGLRLALAVLLIGWVVSGDEWQITRALALLAAFALLWNSIFARCYLWKWLGLSSCRGSDAQGRCGGSKA